MKDGYVVKNSRAHRLVDLGDRATTSDQMFILRALSMFSNESPLCGLASSYVRTTMARRCTGIYESSSPPYRLLSYFRGP